MQLSSRFDANLQAEKDVSCCEPQMEDADQHFPLYYHIFFFTLPQTA